MTDLADFLLARFAEDEAWGRTEADGWPWTGGPNDPVRVLAECDAKRRIVEYWARADDDWAAGSPMAGYRAAMRDVLHALTLPYADHPEFDQAWRP